jgi:hypothetical protein
VLLLHNPRLKDQCRCDRCVLDKLRKPVQARSLRERLAEQRSLVSPRSEKAGRFELNQALFWRKVARDGPGGCWIWLGRKTKPKLRNPTSYGVYSNRRAHRLAYELASKRTIAPGMTIDHTCFNTLCVNPAHLCEVTRSENAGVFSPWSRLGVYREGYFWVVRICFDGLITDYGSFPTIDNALQAAFAGWTKLAESETRFAV